MTLAVLDEPFDHDGFIFELKYQVLEMPNLRLFLGLTADLIELES